MLLVSEGITWFNKTAKKKKKNGAGGGVGEGDTAHERAFVLNFSS